MIIPIIEINQPIGSFYITSLPAKILTEHTKVVRRKDGGVQRDLSAKRIKEIAAYCSDPDATFPTPIIISFEQSNAMILDDGLFQFDENAYIGEIIDGQHRIEGLKLSNHISKFTLPVVLMFDLTNEEKAYVFSIINSTQTKVPMSLIYDLFGLSSGRSPQKTCHEVARLLNSDEDSPLFRRLKMLGKKEKDDDLASLSQGSFIKYLMPLISKNPSEDAIRIKKNRNPEPDSKLPLRQYFINNKDEFIYKVLRNMFSAVKEVFPNEWNDPSQYILTKTTGYGGIMKAFPELYKLGNSQKRLSEAFFC